MIIDLTSTHPHDISLAYSDINVIRMGGRDLWEAALNELSEEDRKFVAFDGQHRLDVLSDLGQLVSTARDTSINKRWRFHRPGSGQTVILRDLFSKIVIWIDRFKQIGDIVVQYDPVHAALPWAGVRFLLKVCRSPILSYLAEAKPACRKRHQQVRVRCGRRRNNRPQSLTLCYVRANILGIWQEPHSCY